MADDYSSDMRETYTPEQKVKDYERIFSILQSISSTLQIDEILKRILRETLDLCGADQGSIVLLKEEGTEDPLTLIRHGESRESMVYHYLNTIVCGWIIHHKTQLITDDLTATFGDEQVKNELRDISSLLGIPLIIDGKILGVLSVISMNRNKIFGERERHVLHLLSGPCAQFIVNARLHESYYNEARRLRHEIGDKFSMHGVIGRSPGMQQIFSLLERVMHTDARVLMEGESGTGKELVARILHYEGLRKDNPFIAVDCGVIPHNLFESELFGNVKGAFTGADRDRTGIIEEANGGTLFLDEITNMPVDVQSKFLRVVDEGEFRPIGSSRNVKVDVRIIAAASVDVRSLTKNGKFRKDLYYRLNVINIVLPPLRERKVDIPILADHYLAQHSKKYGKSFQGFKPDTMEFLEQYTWPGNIRELENVIERIVVLAGNETEYITADLLPPEIRFRDDINDSGSGQDEGKIILDALMKNNWNQSAAARQLGMGESTLRYKINKFGLKKG